MVSIALVGLLEWEEIGAGRVPRSRLGRIKFACVPLAYAGMAAAIFIVSPLADAAHIRRVGEAACARHGGIDTASVSLRYASVHSWTRAYSGQAGDEVFFACYDGVRMEGRYAGAAIDVAPVQ